MTETDQMQKWRKWKRLGFLTAVVPPCVGLAATLAWMTWRFQSLDVLAPSGDPSTVSIPTGEVLIPTLIALPVGLLGGAIFLTGAVKLRGAGGQREIIDGNPPH
jgi:hypothetical protein